MERFEAIDSSKNNWKTEMVFLGRPSRKISSKRRSAVKKAQDILVSVKPVIDNLKSLEEYQQEQAWLDEVFYNLTEVEWKEAKEEVSEILYKWGRFLLDHGRYQEGLARFWELYEKFPETRWHGQVFEELVALEQPEEMVFIPVTSFTLGNEGKESQLKPYFLDIYPVTNSQYLEFVKKTGYPAPAHWIAGMYPIGKGNHPATWVSVEDAMAYASWQNKRLPTEMEWENAAKGPDDLKWPWGKHYETKRCNCRESGVGDTTPVNQYPIGKSCYQCFDLAGNIWEWTDSWYDSSHCYRVLRGGSWFTFEEYTTTIYRNFDFADSRKGIYGFRCCKSFGRTGIKG